MDLAVESLPARVAASPDLARWGRHLDAEVLLEVGERSWLLTLRDGQVAAVRAGPFVMPASTIALHIEPQALARLLAPEPPPGWHDLLSLRRHGALRVEGDTATFFAPLIPVRKFPDSDVT